MDENGQRPAGHLRFVWTPNGYELREPAFPGKKPLYNLDVIAEADWLIDLGPEGGDGGGRIVYQGTPERAAKGHTAAALSSFLADRQAA